VVPSDLQPAMSVAHRVAEARAPMSLAAAPKRLSADDIVRAKMAVVVGRMSEDGQSCAAVSWTGPRSGAKRPKPRRIRGRNSRLSGLRS
jgi:hypothetical protein